MSGLYPHAEGGADCGVLFKNAGVITKLRLINLCYNDSTSLQFHSTALERNKTACVTVQKGNTCVREGVWLCVF